MLSSFKDQDFLLTDKENLSEIFKDLVFQDSFCRKLEAFLPSKRWYSAKDDTIAAVSFQALMPLEKVFLAVVLVALKGGEKPTFLIPLRAAFGEAADNVPETAVISGIETPKKKGVIYDAAGDDDFAGCLLPLLEKDETVEIGDGMSLAGTSTAAGKALICDVDGLPQKMLGVEQSNTSLIIGKKIMLKMYRRTAFGSHPEVATTSFLTQEAKFKNTPAYLGSLELKYADGKTMALGILQSFVPNIGDGWSYTMDYLKSYFAEALSGQTGLRHTAYLKEARLLGQRTAEMHKAFAKGTDEVFRPVPVTAEDLAAWRNQVMAQADKTLAAAKANVDHLSGDVKKRVENLINSRDRIAARASELLPVVADGQKTRFHGDYHLGQVVLDDKGDFYILDFEGEPLRPITERQIKQSVLKDVAGMVRSFDYAAFGAVLLYVLPENREKALKLAAKWQQKATEAFLEGYFDNMDGCDSLPADKEITLKLLDLFVLEKALYEVIYEVANRPDWLAIPMNGLARLVNLDGE
ncbi:MAG: putative maltokinase [Alphaproteobacteria bacterium]|nr:putative maltokinase [Alphaproteobacteria bacterium]